MVLILMIGSLYWLSNAVDQRQGEIEKWVSTHIGYPVSIETIGLTWVGLFPKLDLNTVAITNEHQSTLLALEHLYVGVDLFSSIKQRMVMLDDIILSGLSINLVRNTDGSIVIEGMQPQTSSTQKINWNQWLSLAESLKLNSISLNFQDRVHTDLSGEYEITEAMIYRDGYQITVVANATLPSQLGTRFSFDLVTQTDQQYLLTDWQLNIDLEQLKLASLTPYLNFKGIEINQGEVALEVNAAGHSGTVSQLSAQLDSAGVSFRSNADKSTFDITTLSGFLDWKKNKDGWQIKGQSFNISTQDLMWLPTDFTIQKHLSNIQINSSFIELADVSRLLSLSNELPNFITEQDLAGKLRNLELTLSETLQLEQLNFELEKGQVEQWTDYPGIEGLSASVKWDGQQGELALESDNLIISSPILLEKKVSFSDVSGGISWQKSGDSWLFTSDRLALKNDDLSVALDGNVSVDNAQHILSDLSLALDNVHVNTWKKYVPQHILSDDFKEWSEHAFVAGIISDGTIKMKGALADFPYEKETENNSFLMRLNVADAQLHYGPGWPDIEKVNGTIKTDGTALVIKSKSGTLAGFKFNDVTTSISRFMLSNPILTTVGTLDGTTQQALDFLKNSPLKDRFESVSTVFKAQGTSRVNLDLMVPLINVNSAEAVGEVSFNNSEFQNTMMPKVVVKQVNGSLAFNNSGVSANNIVGQFFGEEVIIDVQPENATTLVHAKSKVSSATLNELSDGQLPAEIKGEMPLKLTIEVSEKEVGDFYVNAFVDSDLTGMAIDLPQPFTKNKHDPRLFKASIKNQQQALVYNAQYGQLINALIMPTDGLWRGEIKLGKGEPSLPASGIKVSGQLDNVVIDDWLTWVDNKDKPSKESPFMTSLGDVSLTINSLLGFNQSLSHLVVSAQKELKGWTAQFSSDQTTGHVYLPHDLSGQLPVIIEADKVIVSLPKSSAQSEKKSTNNAKKEQVLWPAVTLDIGHLAIDEMSLGKLHLTATRSIDSWTINKGSLVSPNYAAEISSAQWKQSEGQEYSQIKVTAKSANLSGFLSDFGYLPSISSNNVELHIDAFWPSNPLDIERKLIEGTLALNVGRGKLNDVEPGAAGRIFGLLSITAIPRRLSLDFSELFSKGFNFSSIMANFELANGIAQTNNMKVIADSATIDITGPIDIINQTYNQKVAVIPNVSSSLPIAGAVAGGPIGLGVGTAILLVDKLANQLFDKNIGNLITYKYDLTGPWKEPELKTSSSTSR